MTERKKEHIDLALSSQTNKMTHDDRFNYEPMLSAHPDGTLKPINFAGKTMRLPIWISSMTGGSEVSGVINRNLARACNEFGMGMGLGSCRVLLETGKFREQFNLRDIIGDDYPFYANLGINQVEKAVLNNTTKQITSMVEELRADGLIIHVNPIQEWLQPEGDRLTVAPVETIKTFLAETGMRVIVKEVGQGFGPESSKALLRLPLEAVEFGAYGGTNFAQVELKRRSDSRKFLLEPFAGIGHDAYQMIDEINKFIESNEDDVKCRAVIVSGGVRNFLDGYYFINKIHINAVYGQASVLLTHAMGDYDKLKEFIEVQVEGLKLAYAYLKIK
jgi:isopentenyl-diphosphate Delta-isomerase